MKDSRLSPTAYSTRSIISLTQNNDSKFFTNGIKELVRDHRIALQLLSTDKELFQEFRQKTTQKVVRQPIPVG